MAILIALLLVTLGWMHIYPNHTMMTLVITFLFYTLILIIYILDNDKQCYTELFLITLATFYILKISISRYIQESEKDTMTQDNSYKIYLIIFNLLTNIAYIGYQKFQRRDETREIDTTDVTYDLTIEIIHTIMNMAMIHMLITYDQRKKPHIGIFTTQILMLTMYILQIILLAFTIIQKEECLMNILQMTHT